MILRGAGTTRHICHFFFAILAAQILVIWGVSLIVGTGAVQISPDVKAANVPRISSTNLQDTSAPVFLPSPVPIGSGGGAPTLGSAGFATPTSVEVPPI